MYAAQIHCLGFCSSLGAHCCDRGATCKPNANLAQWEGTRAVDAVDAQWAQIIGPFR